MSNLDKSFKNSLKVNNILLDNNFEYTNIIIVFENTEIDNFGRSIKSINRLSSFSLIIKDNNSNTTNRTCS